VASAALAGLGLLVAILVLSPTAALASPPETPETKLPTAVTGTTATLNGVLDPKAPGEAGTYEFRFRASATECEGEGERHTPEPPAAASGNAEEHASAEATGLLPSTQYTFCLFTENGAAEASEGAPVTFTTSATAPIVGEETVGVIGTAEAAVGAKIDAGGLPTEYRIEYGTSVAYGASTAETSIGAPRSAVAVQKSLSGLQPGTLYHFRFAAANSLGISRGGDETFGTARASTAAGSSLPDGRAYEMVSPLANADGNVYVPALGGGLPGHDDITSQALYRASADGNAVAYAGEPLATGGDGFTSGGAGNQFLATRTANGWVSIDVMPEYLTENPFRGFSEDLSIGILTSSEQPPLSPDAPANCIGLFSKNTGSREYRAVLTTTQTPGECGLPIFAGISADKSHFLFESEARLTPGAPAGINTGGETERTFNLYESVDGRLHLVNVLPNGRPAGDSTFGWASGVSGEEPIETGGSPQAVRNFGQIVSTDGSRIVWTDRDTEVSSENPTGATRLFIRENADRADASTVQVDAAVGAGGQYWGASDDDSKIFFTKSGHLYEYALKSGATVDLTPAGSVKGVTGINADGTYVYFVTGAALAPGAVSGNCETAPQGPELEEEEHGRLTEGRVCNLYLYNRGETRFIAGLAPSDNTLGGPSENSEGFTSGRFGDWRASPNRRFSEVTPDGRNVVFMSRRSLTGYDNAGELEVFAYSAGAQQLNCVSCNPNGRPGGRAFLPTPLFSSGESSSLLHWLSVDGTRVFFDSTQALVPQDTNGVLDVYEWERGGSRGCEESTGCIHLISGNLTNDGAFLVDASANGNDVFFTSRAQLVPQDRNEDVDLYDARVDGGFPQLSTECTGSGCQGIPPAPPIFATPASVTFSGIGNFPPPVPVRKLKSKPKSKPTKCRSGLRGRKTHNKCVKAKRKKAPARKANRNRRGKS
jgi:hypothetical protein